MRNWSRSGLILLFALAMPACGQRTVSVPANDTPGMIATATTLPQPTATESATAAATPTNLPTRTLEPTPTPQVSFDAKANAYRIRFAPNGTWVEFTDTISAGSIKRYVLSAMQGQVMSVSIRNGPAYQVIIAGADSTPLNDPRYPQPFWRGSLPATQNYFVSVMSQVDGPFTLRIAIAPPGQAKQYFEFNDPDFKVSLTYSDEFAPTDVQVPIDTKGTTLLTLALIDPGLYAPTTNLIEAYLRLAASKDPAVVSTCAEASTLVPETVTGHEILNGYTFTISEFSGAAAGNRYDQTSYRTVWDDTCFEMTALIHSANIGNYPSGSVTEFDRASLMEKFKTVLNTFQAE